MSRAAISRFERSGVFGPHGCKPWPCQINDLKIDTRCFLAWRSALLDMGKDWFGCWSFTSLQHLSSYQVWLTQCQDSVVEWDMMPWCWQPGLPMRQHYKVAMSVRCHKSVPTLIWPSTLLGCKTTNNQHDNCLWTRPGDRRRFSQYYHLLKLAGPECSQTDALQHTFVWIICVT